MTTSIVEKDVVLKRVNGIQHEIAEVTPKELYGVIHNDLEDFDIFLYAVKNVLEHPEHFGLKVE